MGLFKEVTNTVKNIFNADDDMMFDDEKEFEETKKVSMPKIQFGKKPDNNPQVFDASNHGFNINDNQNRRNKSNGRIQVYVPKTFEEAFNIIKDVKSGFTAMVNVEVANPQISQRIIDLISGAIYALDGDCKKMGEKQYIFSLSTETVGAYDYLPVNGGGNNPQNGQFNFNMAQPFDFMNQQSQSMQSYGMPQQMPFSQPQQQPPQFNFGQNNTQPQFNFNQQATPPQSQF